MAGLKETADEVADEVEELVARLEKLNESKLSRNALAFLIQKACGTPNIPLNTIHRILDCPERLREFALGEEE